MNRSVYLIYVAIAISLSLSACNREPRVPDTSGYLETPYFSTSTIVFPEITDSSITMLWSDVGTSYTVERAIGDGAYSKIAEVSNTLYADTGLFNNTFYKYRVADQTGNIFAEAMTATMSVGEVSKVAVLPQSVNTTITQAATVIDDIRTYYTKLPSWKTYTGYDATKDGTTTTTGSVRYWDTKYKQIVAQPSDARCAREQWFDPNNYCVAQFRRDSLKTIETFDKDTTIQRLSINEAWLGMLVQGKDIKNNAFAFSQINVPTQYRARLVVGSTSLPAGQQTLQVQASPLAVEGAINTLVQRLTSNQTKFPLPTTSYFRSTAVTTVEQTAFGLGIKFNIFGADIKGTLSSSLSTNQNAAAAIYRQEAFTVLIKNPNDPASFFTNNMPQSVFNGLVQRGEINLKNPPAVLSEIRYGRFLLLTLTSSETAQRLVASINLLSDGEFKCENDTCTCTVTGSGVCAGLDYSRIISEASKQVRVYGGTEDKANAAIRDKDLTKFFEGTTPASAFLPLTYVYAPAYPNGGTFRATVTLTTPSISTKCSLVSASFLGVKAGGGCSQSTVNGLPK